MANVGLVCYNIIGGDGLPLPNKINIFDQDIVLSYPNANSFKKVGVLAPPGTKIIFNKNKNVIVGRTGIYELDDDIPPIEHMQFVRPIIYELNPGKTEAALAKGEELLNKAESARLQALDDLYALNLEGSEFWEKYILIDENFRNSEDYTEGLRLYKEGVNGIYDNKGEGDLDNVIIDFIYL